MHETGMNGPRRVPTVFRKSAQLSLVTSCYIQLCHTYVILCLALLSYFSREITVHMQRLSSASLFAHVSLLSSIFGERKKRILQWLPCWTLSVPLEALKSMQVNAGSPSAAGWRILRSGASPGAANSTWHSSIFQHIPAYSRIPVSVDRLGIICHARSDIVT